MAKRRIRLTEGQLYGLVESALNELDWRTYDNALKDVDKRLYDFHGGGWAYDNLWRKYLKRALQKKIGKEETDSAFRNLRDEWGNDGLYELLSELFKDEIIADLKQQRSNFANARTQAFADRHGHDRTDYTGYDENGNPESYYDKDFDELVPRDYMTVDSRGNYYDLEDGSIDMKNGVIGTAASGTDYPTENGWKSERAKTGWKTYDRTAETGNDEDNTWDLKGDDEGYSKKFPRTAAAEELAAKKSGRARYNRGKGWANESIARKVTENVIRKLRRGLSEGLQKNWASEWDDSKEQYVALIDNQDEVEVADVEQELGEIIADLAVNEDPMGMFGKSLPISWFTLVLQFSDGQRVRLNTNFWYTEEDGDPVVNHVGVEVKRGNRQTEIGEWANAFRDIGCTKRIMGIANNIIASGSIKNW